MCWALLGTTSLLSLAAGQTADLDGVPFNGQSLIASDNDVA